MSVYMYAHARTRTHTHTHTVTSWLAVPLEDGTVRPEQQAERKVACTVRGTAAKEKKEVILKSFAVTRPGLSLERELERMLMKVLGVCAAAP
jgi:hypothetical protein